MARNQRTRWEDGAACTDSDPEIFFELETAVDEERMPDLMIVSGAMHTCAGCPIAERCFKESVYSRSLGIWGGTTAAERGIRYRGPVRSE